ncbi:MAG: endolytic transglycosylase MltG [Proteobacteria bacterium]|nr:endolytic transglycosylase MltG [Pseudomonadota bacterium]
MAGKGGGVLRVLGWLVLIAVIAFGATMWWGWAQVESFIAEVPSGEHEERILEIPRGSGPQTISTLLANEGVITDSEKFALFLRWKKAAPGLRAGEFRFWTDQTPEQVLDVLLNAAEVTYSVTIAPGLRIEEMGAKAEEAGRGSAERYTQLARDAAFIESLGLGMDPPPEHLEGLLVPETYSFGRDADEEDLLRAQIARYKEIWNAERRATAEAIGMTPYEVTTLASVVEKETGAAQERPLIAGVFHNRLRRGMKLESDPTIIYGLVNYDGNIRRSDIRRPHPWNTYVIPALPPTPIAGPGVEAIDAVLNPTETKAIFFVSRNDGTHHFSETYAEHARMVRKYQRGGR